MPLAPAHLVDGLGTNLLAAPTLPDQQHGGRGRGDARQLLVQRLHGGRVPQDVAEAAELAQFLAQFSDLGVQVRTAWHAVEDGLQPAHVDWFQ